MINLELQEDYKLALKEANKKHNDPIGITAYEGKTPADVTYPRIFNTQTIMLTIICEKINKLERKVDSLEEKIKVLATNQAVDNLELMFNKIKITPDHTKIEKKGKKCRSW